MTEGYKDFLGNSNEGGVALEPETEQEFSSLVEQASVRTEVDQSDEQLEARIKETREQIRVAESYENEKLVLKKEAELHDLEKEKNPKLEVSAVSEVEKNPETRAEAKGREKRELAESIMSAHDIEGLRKAVEEAGGMHVDEAPYFHTLESFNELIGTLAGSDINETSLKFSIDKLAVTAETKVKLKEFFLTPSREKSNDATTASPAENTESVAGEETVTPKSQSEAPLVFPIIPVYHKEKKGFFSRMMESFSQIPEARGERRKATAEQDITPSVSVVESKEVSDVREAMARVELARAEEKKKEQLRRRSGFLRFFSWRNSKEQEKPLRRMKL